MAELSDWKTCKLGDVVKFGNGKVRPKTGGNIPVYGGNGILQYSDEFNYSGETIIIGRVGAYCGSTYYENRDIWISDNALSAKPKEKNSPKFLYYLLKNMNLNSHAQGSSHPLLTQTLLNNLETIVPVTEKEQEAIAEVLSSLDDKIDLLHRQNKTLEALAETLFRHHFINNPQPNWKKGKLDEVADYLNGLACQKHPPKNDVEKLPVLKIKDLRNGFTENSDWATSNVSEKYIVKSGDIIFSWSGSLLVKIWDGKDCVLNQHLFKVTSAEHPKWFIYYWTKYHLDKFTAIAESKATTMGHIKRSDLSSSMVIVPTKEALAEIDQFMQPIIDKVILNNKQISKLEKIRDKLLPKLISGDVRVQYEEV